MKTFTTSKGEYCLVPVQEGVTNMDFTMGYLIGDSFTFKQKILCRLPPGQWELLSPDVWGMSEEQWREIVPLQMKGLHGMLETYPLYIPHAFMTYVYTATNSGLSLLRSLEIQKENPLQSEWDESCTWGHGGCTYKEYHDAAKGTGRHAIIKKI